MKNNHEIILKQYAAYRQKFRTLSMQRRRKTTKFAATILMRMSLTPIPCRDVLLCGAVSV